MADLSDAEMQTLRLLHRISLPMERALAAADRASGCSSAQLSALSGILFFGADTISALAAHERVRTPTISRIVDSLVAAGLVERSADPGDRRTSRLEVTARGRAAIVAACDGRVERLAGITASLSAQEWRALSVASLALNRVFGLAAPTYVPRSELEGDTDQTTLGD